MTRLNRTLARDAGQHPAPALRMRSRRRPYREAVQDLVTVVQQLSLAHDLDTVMAIVRRAARELTGADGASFVLRDGDQCFYADENAISPLWKGRRFPMDTCISGWSMLHREAAVIEDIYRDPRIPVDAYRPTFVRSLAMVPIRTLDPIGAIGNYWARRHRPTADEVQLLQALADSTAVALENVRVYGELEQRVRDRTAELEAVNARLHAEIDERRKAEAEVRRLSLTDELTGLHDRRGFVLLAEQELAIARRSATPAWLVFADLDGLKQVNDELGHDAGDAMLREAAGLLKSTFRHADVIARIGGDEFAVLAMTGSGSAEEIRTRLQKHVAAFNGGRHGGQLSMSAGVISVEGSDSLASLLARADAAMYEQKRARRKRGARSAVAAAGR